MARVVSTDKKHTVVGLNILGRSIKKVAIMRKVCYSSMATGGTGPHPPSTETPRPMFRLYYRGRWRRPKISMAPAREWEDGYNQ